MVLRGGDGGSRKYATLAGPNAARPALFVRLVWNQGRRVGGQSEPKLEPLSPWTSTGTSPGVVRLVVRNNWHESVQKQRISGVQQAKFERALASM